MTGNATQEDTRRFQRHIERKKKEILELENDVLEKREKVSCLTYKFTCIHTGGCFQLGELKAVDLSS